jgi:hypothetical protein
MERMRPPAALTEARRVPAAQNEPTRSSAQNRTGRYSSLPEMTNFETTAAAESPAYATLAGGFRRSVGTTWVKFESTSRTIAAAVETVPAVPRKSKSGAVGAFRGPDQPRFDRGPTPGLHNPLAGRRGLHR